MAKGQKNVKKPVEKYVRICPKCKSPDIYLDKSTLQQLGELPTMYICNKCGHSGYTFPEVALSDFEDFEKEVDEDNMRDTQKDKTPLLDDAYGKFEVRFVWKFLAPIILILGVIYVFVQPIAGIVLLALGLFIGYITYFKKRKLKDD